MVVNRQILTAISAHNLTVSFGDTPILKGLDFEIHRGEWVGVLGPNGAGKSTLLRALTGLIEASGDILLDKTSVSSWTPRDLARRMAFVRQSHALSFDFRVEELVMLGRSPHKSLLSVYTGRDHEYARKALGMVDLGGFEDRGVLSLSGGELQRVFLAQALVQEADILLLDEPTTHLDVHHQYVFLEHVQRQVDEGKTVIGAFHDLELASRFCDRFLVLNHGEIEALGPATDVLSAELIARVFRMKASVDTLADGSIRIQYTATLDGDV